MQVSVLEPGRHVGAVRCVERDDPGHAQLDRFLHHPGKPIAVSGCYGQGHFGWAFLPLDTLDLNQPIPPGLQQAPGAPKS
jgi:hypothetical protein